jgi:predicted nucleic acid-binding protein
VTLVVDASVAAKWFLDEPQHEEARALITSGDDLVAPEFLLLEVANILWKKIRRSEVDLPTAQANLKALRRGEPEFVDSRLLMARALDLADELEHPIYDCLYLALARAEKAQVVTADQRFHKRVSDSDYAESIALLGA